MKLRIKGNSLRIRLTRSEVDNFAIEGYLEENTIFANKEFVYTLEAKQGISGLQAAYEGDKISLYVPAEIPAIWAANEQVGYENTINTTSGNQLYLLLEKDFKCLDAPPTEDQSDNFDNPHKTC